MKWKIDSDKMQSINTWSESINVKKLQAFLSFVNYNKKFIRNYFKKALSLTNLTNKDKSWHWKEREQTTFKKLRNACLKDSILKIINMTKSIKIEIDAFDLIIKICFIQQKKNKWRSATYFSRKLSSTE